MSSRVQRRGGTRQDVGGVEQRHSGDVADVRPGPHGDTGRRDGAVGILDPDGLKAKNPNSRYVGRTYLSCRQHPPCEFFQWVNQPCSGYVQDVRARLGQLPAIHSLKPAPKNQWRKPDRQLAVGESPLPPQLPSCTTFRTCKKLFLRDERNKIDMKMESVCSFDSRWPKGNVCNGG